MNSSEDLGLDTLLSVRAELAPELDEELLKNCYLIQRRHQFTGDRNLSVTAIERLVDEVVAKESREASPQ